MTDRPEGLSAATLAIARLRRVGEHSQRCPVVLHKAGLERCDCWIIKDARNDAEAALDAARDSRPVGEGHADKVLATLDYEMSLNVALNPGLIAMWRATLTNLRAALVDTGPVGDREEIDVELTALMADVEVALAAARLWLVGEYADRPRSEFNAEAWQALADRVGPLLASHPGWMHTARTFRLVPSTDQSASTEVGEAVRLGCGCRVEEHDNTLAAMHEKHPEISFPTDDGLARYYAGPR